jgi:hypothetical protein
VADSGQVAAFLGGGVAVFLLDNAWRALSGRWQQTRDKRVAALLVADELRANIVRLQIALEGTPEEVADLQSQTYQDFQAVLARHLDRETRDAVRAAYVFARVPRVLHRVNLFGVVTISATGSPPPPPVIEIAPIQEHVKEALRRAEKAYGLLRRHAGPAADI